MANVSVWVLESKLAIDTEWKPLTTCGPDPGFAAIFIEYGSPKTGFDFRVSEYRRVEKEDRDANR